MVSTPSCWASTASDRDGAMRNTVVSGPTNTQHHQRWLSLPATAANTFQLVSSTCRCAAAALRWLIAAASGASRSEHAANTPASVPSARSSPSWASAATMRWAGRPSTNFSTSNRAKNPMDNRPLAIALDGGGATNTPRTGQRQVRR